MQNWIIELQTGSGIVCTIPLSLGSHLCLTIIRVSNLQTKFAMYY
jgi:hypothetical protein